MDIKVRTPNKIEVSKMDFSKWGTWECRVSKFPWSYDATETCYILAGHVIVETNDGKVEFKEGDLVVFPKGLTCTWNVLEPVRKYYKFD